MYGVVGRLAARGRRPRSGGGGADAGTVVVNPRERAHRRYLACSTCLVFCLILVGCATHYTPAVVDNLYGIVSGCWHGLISPFALLANFVSWLAGLVGLSVWDSIEIVGRPNTGTMYYADFVVGLLAYGGIVASN